MNELSESGIISYNRDAQTIIPNNEAHIMTRHIITTKTMKILMELPRICHLSQVYLRYYKLTHLLVQTKFILLQYLATIRNL